MPPRAGPPPSSPTDSAWVTSELSVARVAGSASRLAHACSIEVGGVAQRLAGRRTRRRPATTAPPPAASTDTATPALASVTHRRALGAVVVLDSRRSTTLVSTAPMAQPAGQQRGDDQHRRPLAGVVGDEVELPQPVDALAGEPERDHHQQQHADGGRARTDARTRRIVSTTGEPLVEGVAEPAAAPPASAPPSSRPSTASTAPPATSGTHSAELPEGGAADRARRSEPSSSARRPLA